VYAWIAVAVGGAAGSLARHGVNVVVHQQWPAMRFPLATAVVNIAGCLVIGVLAGLVAAGQLPMRAHWRELIFVGVLGGFTTFSTFGLDTITLVRGGAGGQAIVNVVVQVACGLGGVYAGLAAGERLGALAR
jgi:fluoride exporter